MKRVEEKVVMVRCRSYDNIADVFESDNWVIPIAYVIDWDGISIIIDFVYEEGILDMFQLFLILLTRLSGITQLIARMLPGKSDHQ